MATVKIVILKHQKREDGTWNVKIRITHDRKSAYIATSHYIGNDLINKKTFELKERCNPVYDHVMVDVIKIRSEFTKLGHSIDNFTAKGLCALMESKISGKDSDGINFFDYAYSYADKVIFEGRRIGENYKYGIHKFETFVGHRDLNFSDITSNLLRKYDEYLHKMPSKNRTGLISDSGVRLYMSKIQAIFNKAKEEFNDEDSGVIRISNNPFGKYKMPKNQPSKKRALSRDQILAICNFEVPQSHSGTLIARDVFIMSFLMVGINTVDMFHLKPPVDGRLEYERRKTRTRREDKAFISIRVEPELLPYIDRYKDMLNDRLFNFFIRYADAKQFVRKVNINLKNIGDALGIEHLTFYAARHTWATIARNDCGVSMDDVAMSLNHKSGHNITDTYVKKDWSAIDIANRKVIDFVFGEKKEAGE